MTSGGSESAATVRPKVWGNVPPRNRNFTGRAEILSELRQRVAAKTTALVSVPQVQPTQALYGLGGVGKTQLAIEYAHRYAGEYQVVWWIPADQTALVRSAIAALAPRLDITDLAPGRVEDATTAVLDALRRGDPYERWLLIFDNADHPNSIRDLIPTGPGDVIITSRNRGWAHLVDALEVDVFTREESMQFLTRRVPGIVDAYADRLADEFGDLPLGLEQAAAWLVETAMRVDEYIGLVQKEGSRILSEGPAPSDYPLPVAAAWSLSVTRLRTQTPEALELLQCCAFFGPAAIQLELLERGRYVLTSQLRTTLSDPILFGRAIRALGRYSLARIDNYRQTIEVHRIIQRVIRDDLDSDTRYVLRHEVHMLLSAADPGNPDEPESWPKYKDLLAHAGPSEVVECRTQVVRHLAQNVVRYLYVTGDYEGALESAEKALIRWTADSGPDDPYVLMMTRLKIQVLQALARYEEAYDLDTAALERMRTVLGEDHEETLILLNCRCIDLWARGDFAKSLELTASSLQHHKTVFGDEHPRTFAAVNNYAEALELSGRYAVARELQEELYQAKLVAYGRDDHARVLFTLGALGRATLEEGRYAKAREIAERAYEGYGRLVRAGVLPDNHPWVLEQGVDLSMARRATGAFSGALALAEETYGRYQRAYFGAENHPRTLAAAASLGNSQRLAGDLEPAAKLLEDTFRRYHDVFGPEHPYVLSCSVNLAITQRRLGDLAASRTLLEGATKGLSERLGRHHHALICVVDLASTLAELGDVEQAARRGEESLPDLVALLGPDHPDALACAANLALDLKATGQDQRAAELLADTIERLRRVLGDDHPEVQDAVAGRRLDLGIELVATF